MDRRGYPPRSPGCKPSVLVNELAAQMAERVSTALTFTCVNPGFGSGEANFYPPALQKFRGRRRLCVGDALDLMQRKL